MTRKFIPGLIGAALVAGCLSAQAMPAGDADLTHNYAVTGLAHKGNYVTDLHPSDFLIYEDFLLLFSKLHRHVLFHVYQLTNLS